jgi:hypothetical protein
MAVHVSRSEDSRQQDSARRGGLSCGETDLSLTAKEKEGKKLRASLSTILLSGVRPFRVLLAPWAVALPL